MDEVYVYIVDLPNGINEMVVPCCDGYTVYIDVKLSHDEKLDAYRHALTHIRNDDHHCGKTASDIEQEAHKTGHGKEFA